MYNGSLQLSLTLVNCGNTLKVPQFYTYPHEKSFSLCSNLTGIESKKRSQKKTRNTRVSWSEHTQHSAVLMTVFRYHHTGPISSVYALREGLARLAEIVSYLFISIQRLCSHMSMFMRRILCCLYTLTL